MAENLLNTCDYFVLPSMDFMIDKENRELILDILKNLEEENEREKRDAHQVEAEFGVSSAMSLITNIADSFYLPHHVKYMALDILQRYLVVHIVSLLEHVMSTTDEGQKRERLMKAVEKKVRDQVPLRAVTCVMIASKLTLHKKSMTLQMCQKSLKTMKLTVSLKAVARSEINVLEQIQSRCLQRSSLAEYVGVMAWAGCLGDGDFSGLCVDVENSKVMTVKAEQVLDSAWDILDLVLLCHHEIYLDLYKTLTGLPNIVQHHRAAFSHVMADKLLLAASVVTAGAHIVGGDISCCAMVASITHHTNTISTRDILTLATCIIRATNLPLNPLALLDHP